MRRIIQEHLGVWIVAGMLVGGLGISSAMSKDEPAASQTAIEGAVVSPRGAISLYQDYTGQFSTYRRIVAHGSY